MLPKSNPLEDLLHAHCLAGVNHVLRKSAHGQGADAHVHAGEPIDLQGRDGNRLDLGGPPVRVPLASSKRVRDAAVDVDVHVLNVALLVHHGDVLHGLVVSFRGPGFPILSDNLLEDLDIVECVADHVGLRGIRVDGLLVQRCLEVGRSGLDFQSGDVRVVDEKAEDESLHRVGDGGRLDLLEEGWGGVYVGGRGCVRRLDGRGVERQDDLQYSPVEHSYLPLSAFTAVLPAIAGEARQKSVAASAAEALVTKMVGLGGGCGCCVLGWVGMCVRGWALSLVDDGVPALREAKDGEGEGWGQCMVLWCGRGSRGSEGGKGGGGRIGSRKGRTGQGAAKEGEMP